MELESTISPNVIIRTAKEKDFDAIRKLVLNALYEVGEDKWFGIMTRSIEIQSCIFLATIFIVFALNLPFLYGVAVLSLFQLISFLFGAKCLWRPIVDGDSPDLQNWPTFHQNYFLPSEGHFWVAEYQSPGKKEIIGTVAIKPIGDGIKRKIRSILSSSLEGFELRRMCVKKEHRRKGLALKLLQVAVDHAKQHKWEGSIPLSLVLLTSGYQVAGIRLYEKNGFKLLYSFTGRFGLLSATGLIFSLPL